MTSYHGFSKGIEIPSCPRSAEENQGIDPVYCIFIALAVALAQVLHWHKVETKVEVRGYSFGEGKSGSA